jgi:hypothetical protein
MLAWKKILLWGLSIGAGLAIAGSLVMGGLLWYSSRATTPTAWNKSAIKATFDHIDIVADCPAFYYTLENLTDRDYSLADKEGLRLMELDEKGNLVLSDWRDATTGAASGVSDAVAYDLPIFLPARQKLHKYVIRVSFKLPDPEKRKPSESVESYRRRIGAWFDSLGFTGRWVLFDEKNRYQIEFPKGW